MVYVCNRTASFVDPCVDSSVVLVASIAVVPIHIFAAPGNFARRHVDLSFAVVAFAREGLLLEHGADSFGICADPRMPFCLDLVSET